MANLSPSPKLQFFDANGNPLSGGKLYTYAAGTTTPLATYTDSSGSVPNANPVILNSRGEAEVWLGVAAYKFKLTTSTEVEIWTVNNIISSSVQTLADLSEANGSSLVGFLQSGSGAISRTVQSKLRDVVSVKDFGAVADGSGTSGTDNTTAFQNALNSGATKVVVPSGSYLIDTIIIPSNVELDLTGATLLFKAHTTSHNPMIRMGTVSAGVTRAVLRGGKLVGNSAAQTYPAEEWSPGVLIWGSDYCKVIDAEITDCKGDGITIGYDSGRLVSSNCNIVQECEIYANTRQQVAITYGNENSVIDNKISGAIDIEINTGNYEAKNNIVRGNTGRKQTESLTTPRISDLIIAVVSLNTDPLKTHGNIVDGNSASEIKVQYAHSTIVSNNYVVGSNSTQAHLLTINGTRYTNINGNILEVNAAVATGITLGVVKDFGNSNLEMVNNICNGDTTSLPLMYFTAAYGAETASRRLFQNNLTDSGYYWNGSSAADNTEFALFRIDQTNGGSLTITQVAGTPCYTSISRSGANAVVSRPGNNPFGTCKIMPACNNTTAGSATMNAQAAPSVSVSNNQQTITMFTYTPAAGAVSLSAFSFASSGGTGTFWMEAWF